MGGTFSSLFSRLWSKKEIRILILGLVFAKRVRSRDLIADATPGQRWEDNITIPTKGTFEQLESLYRYLTFPK
jgi:hypothetical protein